MSSYVSVRSGTLSLVPDARSATPVNPPVDEDAWTVPPRWWAKALPVRGIGPAPAVRVDPDAAARAARYYDDAAEFVTHALGGPTSDPALAERGLAAAAVDDDAGPFDPLGHAVLGTLVHSTLRYPDSADLLDLWITRFGLSAAAQLVVSMTDLGVIRGPAPAGLLPYEGHPGIAALAPHEMSGDVAPGNAFYGYIVGFRPWPLHARLRRMLAALPDADYAVAVAELAALRGRSRAIDAMVTYLLPAERAWLDEVIDDLPARRYDGDLDALVESLHSCITDRAQAASLDERSGDETYTRERILWLLGRSTTTLYSLVCNLGPSAATLLAEVSDANVSSKTRTLIYQMLSHIPTDDAFGLLLDRVGRKHAEPAVLAAADRYPRRAMRVLAERTARQGTSGRTALRLLRDHVRTHSHLTDQVPLDPAITEALDAEESAAPPTAPADAIPPLLLTPPWIGYRRATPVVLALASASTPVGMAWEEGERQRWAQAAPRYPSGTPGPGWVAHLQFLQNTPRGLYISTFSQAPIELVRPHLAGAQPGFVWRALPDLQRILGRFDADAIDYVLGAVRSKPVGHAEALLPIEGGEIAMLMAHLCTRRSTRPPARAWLQRHVDTAARDLIPTALGPVGKDRSAATAALLLLGATGDGERVHRAAASYGPEAATQIDALLNADPLLQLPRRMPALPSWLRAELLPPLRLAGRDDALPLDAVTNLCLMGALCEPDAAYPGLAPSTAGLDAASLAAWARELFTQWRNAAYPAQQGWILTLQGLVGDDQTVHLLTPLIRAWPGQSAHKRAVAGLDALAGIGTDAALLHLHGISEKLKFPVLKAAAAERIEQIAVDLGLTPDQLGDRLVPTFGLDEADALVLDYGSRSFRIDFDEALRPTLCDSDGTPRKTLPKPGVKDDPELAPAAHARFASLRKGVKTVASDQITRFERAMITRRRWPMHEFRELFAAHPLLIHLVRRLVWGIYDGGQLTRSFRIADGGITVDAAGAAMSVDDTLVIGIAHPCDFPDGPSAWAPAFADLAQPFAQVAREVYVPTDAERTDTRLPRFEGVTVTSAALLALERRGWVREDPQDAGMQISTSKSLPGGATVTLAFSPGISVGDPSMFPDQTILDACVTPLPLGDVHPVDSSEVLRELAALVGVPSPG